MCVESARCVSPGALMMLGSAVIRWSDGTRIEAASSTGASEDVGESMNSSCGCSRQNANMYIYCGTARTVLES